MRRRLGGALGALTLAVALLHLGLLDGVISALRLPVTPKTVAQGAPPEAGRAISSRRESDPPPGPVAVVTALPASPPPSDVGAPPGPSTPPAAPAGLARPPAGRETAPASATPPRPQPTAPRDSAARAVELPPAPDPPATVAEEASLPSDPGASPAPGEAAAGTAGPPAAGPALPPVPVYRTRIPPAARIVYRLSRGVIAGTGELDWRPQAGGYQLRLDGKLPLIGTLITQTSRGRFDAAGLAPERHTDKRLRRGEQAASFQRPLGLVTFSGGAAALPIAPGLQDRLSVMLQLAAVAAAGPQPPPPDQELQIAVAGARGDSAVWALRYEGVQTVETPDGPVRAWRYLRQPASPHDTRAEFWLDPARHFLPVRVRLTDGSGEPLELLRESSAP